MKVTSQGSACLCFLLGLFLLGCDDLFQPKLDGLDTGFGNRDGGVAWDAPWADSGPSGPSDTSDGGVDPGFQYGNAASATFLQGSWRSPIKHTS